MMLCVFGFSDQNRALRALGTRGESERIADGLQERDEGFRNSRAAHRRRALRDARHDVFANRICSVGN